VFVLVVWRGTVAIGTGIVMTQPFR